MSRIGLVLALLFLSLAAFPTWAQGLSCAGGDAVTYDRCQACTTGRQTREFAECKQPTDIRGNLCGARTCQTCTCEIDPWIRGSDTRPAPQPQPQPQPQPRPQPQPQPQRTTPSGPPVQGGGAPLLPRGPRIFGSPDSRTKELTEAETRTCLVVERYKVSPTGNWISLSVRNRCTECIDARVGIQNWTDEFALAPGRGRYLDGYFRAHQSAGFNLQVEDKSEWLNAEDVRITVKDAFTVRCGG